MTMNEPADSRNKRTQFLVVCSVMVSVLVYTLMTSGIFYPIDATEGVFPGGNFVYKFTYRDYAASMGLGRLVRKDWIQQNFETTDDSKQKKENDETVEAFTYHVYLDDPSQMGGRRQRWMSGLLVGDDKLGQVEKMMVLNEKGKRQPTATEAEDKSAREIFHMLPYEQADLPAVDSLVVQFPHTGGFVSSLILSYKVSRV